MRRRPADALALAALLALAPALRAEDAPEKPHVTVSWSTASEVDNFGYFVFRAEAENGPFKQLNAKAIPGAGNSEVTSNYRYEDYDVKPGASYWYYLESVSTAGVKEKFSPVIMRQCCRQLAGHAEGSGKGEAKADAGKQPAKPAPSEAPKKKP